MGDKEVNQLYKDAIYWHLISQGYSEEQAKMEARKRTLPQDEL